MRLSSLAQLFLLVSCLSPRLAFSDTPVPEKVIKQRQKLESGHFRATGTFSNTLGKTHTLEVWTEGDNWLGVFAAVGGKSAKGGDFVKVLLRGRDAYVKIGSSNVQKMNRESAKSYAHYFDVRALGVLLTAEFDAGNSLEEILRSVTFQEFKSKVADEGGFTRLTVGPLPGDAYLSYFFDAQKELACVKSNFASRGGTTVEQSAHTNWIKRAGIWVPESTKLVYRGKTRVNLKLEWLEVNKRFGDKFFHLDSVFPDEDSVLVERTPDHFERQTIYTGNGS